MTFIEVLKCLPVAGLLLAAPVAMAQDKAPDDWRYSTNVYLWMPALSSGTQSGDQLDVEFKDLLKNLNIGAMGYFAARNGPFTLYMDAIYLNLDNKQSMTANFIGIPIPVATEVNLQGVVSTFGASYRFLDVGHTRLEAGVGGRLLWLDADLRVDVGRLRRTVSDSSVNLDAVVALRGRTDLTDKLYLTYEADIGTGQSDLTWQAWGMLNYKLESVTLSAGYRYMGWNFGNDADLLSDLKLHGPIVGVKFEW